MPKSIKEIYTLDTALQFAQHICLSNGICPQNSVVFYVFDVPETSVLSQQQLAWTWGDNSNICGNYGEDSFNERLLSGVSNPPPKDVLIVWINYAITAKKKKNEPKENRPKPQKQPSLCQSNYENNDFLVLMKKQLFF